jgi:hypothetical protein
MKRAWIVPLLSVTMMLAASAAWARPALISGQVVQEAEGRVVTNIHWNTSLAQAEQQARRQGKMVMWVHMLGSMEGAT